MTNKISILGRILDKLQKGGWFPRKRCLVSGNDLGAAVEYQEMDTPLPGLSFPHTHMYDYRLCTYPF
jgi:hypothetical protein